MVLSRSAERIVIIMYAMNEMELPILNWIANHIHTPFLDRMMPVITMLGDHGIFWIIVAVLCIAFKKTRKLGVLLVRLRSESDCPGNAWRLQRTRRENIWTDHAKVLAIKFPPWHSERSPYACAL